MRRILDQLGHLDLFLDAGHLGVILLHGHDLFDVVDVLRNWSSSPAQTSAGLRWSLPARSGSRESFALGSVVKNASSLPAWSQQHLRNPREITGGDSCKRSVTIEQDIHSRCSIRCRRYAKYPWPLPPSRHAGSVGQSFVGFLQLGLGFPRVVMSRVTPKVPTMFLSLSRHGILVVRNRAGRPSSSMILSMRPMSGCRCGMISCSCSKRPGPCLREKDRNRFCRPSIRRTRRHRSGAAPGCSVWPGGARRNAVCAESAGRVRLWSGSI